VSAQPETRTLQILGVAHAPDGSGYYRFYLPYKLLSEQSRHMVMMPPLGTAFNPNPRELDGILQTFDVVALQRPAGPGGVRLLENMVGRTRIVYEVDDDMLQVVPSGLPHLYDERARSTIRRCLRLADMITTSCEPLAEQMGKFNPNVRVLPNFVDEGLLQVQRPRRQRLTIGWAGGSSHLVDWVTITQPLAEVLRTHPEVDLHFIGPDFSPLVDWQLGGELALARPRGRWTKWQPDVWDYYNKIDFDICVIPLADVPFNRSKTAIKALEMAALGIPVVAANRTPYREFVIDGKTGYLVNTPGEWQARLTELVNDADARAELGAGAKEQAAVHTIQGNWQLWEAAYEAAAGGGRRPDDGA
jgi:glycosyltransferase involved in cell wall biosynthesis